jgi:hypothetical protein
VTKMLIVTVFMLAALAWAAAQQPSGTPEHRGGQATSRNSQVPNASEPPASTPGSRDQDAAQSPAQAGSQGQAAITEGCLGGSNPNFTITDKAGTTYKLNLPPYADASPLTPHVGESVQVMGEVKNAGTPDKASIDVSKIGRGAGTCPAGSSRGAQSPPKQ